NGLLYIIATNLELAISTTIRCKIEAEGSICLPAKTMLDLVQNLPAENITIEKVDQGVSIVAEHFKTKLVSLPTDEFPTVPKIEPTHTVNIDGGELKQILESVVFAAATTETQPEISGVLMRLKERELICVATDRYRLAESHMPLPENDAVKDMIVPQKTSHELIRILAQESGPVEMQISDTQAAFVCANTIITSRLVDGTYPEYEQIIPKDANTEVSMASKSLLQAVRASAIFSRLTNSISLRIPAGKDAIEVLAASSDVGETDITVPAGIKGPEQNITLNYRYLSDVLAAINVEQVVMKVVDDSAPVLLVPEGRTDY